MYQKEIIYMGLYKDGSRIGNAGFLKVENREIESQFHLKLQNIPYNIRGRFPVRVYNGSDWKEINGISIQEGGGSWEESGLETAVGVQVQVTLPGGYFLEGRSKTAPEMGSRMKKEERKEREIEEKTEQDIVQDPQAKVYAEKTVGVMGSRHQEQKMNVPDRKPERKHTSAPEITPVMSEGSAVEETVTIQTDRLRDKPVERQEEAITSYVYGIQSNRERKGESRIKEASENRQNDTADQQRAVIITEELQRPEPEECFGGAMDAQTVLPKSVYNLKEDKWEQILDSYEKIHPYGDERIYVKLEPKDFIILQAKYQHLVNNSFLLHGFYNYRYVILGKEQDFYLGVPGVFYEREKMVALMFGFEAFECPGGTARAGEFGYYLRKVEL